MYAVLRPMQIITPHTKATKLNCNEEKWIALNLKLYALEPLSSLQPILAILLYPFSKWIDIRQL